MNDPRRSGLNAHHRSCSGLNAPRRSCSGLNAPRRSCSGLNAPRRSCSGLNAPHRSCSGLNAPRRSCSGLNAPRRSRSGLNAPCRSRASVPLALRPECPHRLVARVQRVAGTRPADFPRAHQLPNCRVSPVFLSRRRRPAPIGIAARPGGGRAGSSRGCCANSPADSP